jgi:hypothetical protein
MAEVGLLPSARAVFKSPERCFRADEAVSAKAPVRITPTAGGPLSDALRGLDFSRRRGATNRASQTPSGAGSCQRAHLHYRVSFLAAFGRFDHRLRGRRNGAPVARGAQENRPKTSAAVDATVRGMHHHGGKKLLWRRWSKSGRGGSGSAVATGVESPGAVV